MMKRAALLSCAPLVPAAWLAVLLLQGPLLAGAQAPEKAVPFTAPSPADLDRVRWIRRPCVDFLEHLRAELERETPLATEAEALALKNDNPGANAKILSALGRLPANDAEVDWDATFHRWLGSDPLTLNMIFKKLYYETVLEELIGLFPTGWDWKFRCFGDLAVIDSWETSEDRLMDRVVFREDLTWSDGKPFTARDVEFSWDVIMDPRVTIPAYRTIASGLRGVKAYGDRTVVYFQKKALATNHLHLSWPTIPRHIYEESRREDPTLQTSAHHVKMNNAEPVTAGPYRVVSWRRSQEIVLERREEWHQVKGRPVRPKPYFKRVRFVILPDNAARFEQFRSGAIDDSQLDTSQWSGVDTSGDAAFYSGRTKVRGDEWTFGFIGWNARSVPPNPFFVDRRVRLAMTHTLDHDFLIKEIFFGIPLAGRGIFHPDSPMGGGLTPYRRDLALAEKLLDEAGWKDTDGDGTRDKVVDGIKVPFEFKMSFPRAGTGPKVAELLRSGLEKVGVKCRVELMDGAAFNAETQEHRAQAFIFALGTGTDPDTVKNIWRTDAYENGRNYFGYSNPEVDALFEKGTLELDPSKRFKIYEEIGRKIYEDHPLTVLFYTPTLWAFSRSLRGYRPSPRGFYTYAPGFFSIWKKK